MEKSNLKYWIWFSRLRNIGYKKMRFLLEKYNTVENIWNLKYEELYELVEQNILTEKNINELLNDKYKRNLDEYMYYMDKNSIKMITIFDDEYPESLKNIFDYPIYLFYKGNIHLLNSKNKKIAMVGCRKYSEYGKNVAIDFSKNLALENVIIISGLAKGIDTFSHIGCLKSKGKTIAVIGNGLDIVYPSENKKLYSEIIKNNGLIISEYIIGTKPLKMNFPERNRIISGVSDGVLVVEAQEKSGTMITVDFALDQGKDIYVVPGSIYSDNCVGTNNLIKEGAKLVTEIDDII